MNKISGIPTRGDRVLKRMILATALSLGLAGGAPAAPNWPNVPYS